MTQHVTHIGNLTGAPELRFGSSGSPVCRFSLACSDRYRDKNGAWQDGATYFARAVAFGDLAEHIAASVNRGDRVVVVGKYVTNQWEHTDEATGEKSTRYSTELHVDDVAASMRWAELRVQRAGRSSAPATVPDAWSSEMAPSSTGTQSEG